MNGSGLLTVESQFDANPSLALAGSAELTSESRLNATGGVLLGGQAALEVDSQLSVGAGSIRVFQGLSYTNKILMHEELPIVFTPSGNYSNVNFPSGTTFIHFDPSQATAQGLVVSDICDLGAPPRTTIFEWRARVGFASAKASDADVELYVATSDGTYSDGGFGSGHAAPTNFNPANLRSLVVVSSAGVNGLVQTSGRKRITSRFINIVGFLPSASGSWDTTDFSYVMLTPVPTEVEDG